MFNPAVPCLPQKHGRYATAMSSWSFMCMSRVMLSADGAGGFSC